MYAQHFPDGYTPSAENAALVEEEEREYERVLAAEKKSQCDLLRRVFGNPFQPLIPLNPFLLTPSIVGLAQTIYEQHSFERMRELADALEEASCDNEEILSHLRQQGVSHYRGCWVIDLLLNKA